MTIDTVIHESSAVVCYIVGIFLLNQNGCVNNTIFYILNTYSNYKWYTHNSNIVFHSVVRVKYSFYNKN